MHYITMKDPKTNSLNKVLASNELFIARKKKEGWTEELSEADKKVIARKELEEARAKVEKLSSELGDAATKDKGDLKPVADKSADGTRMVTYDEAMAELDVSKTTLTNYCKNADEAGVVVARGKDGQKALIDVNAVTKYLAEKGE